MRSKKTAVRRPTPRAAAEKRVGIGKKLSWSLGLVAAALVLAATPKWLAPGLSRPGEVFYFKDDVWNATAKLPGTPADLKVASDGSIWVSTQFRPGLSVYRNGAWVEHSSADFGTKAEGVPGGFAFRGGDVWGATEEGVVRFDGILWRLYREALRSAQPISTAANDAGVWVLDHSGNLSHFEGAAWNISNIRQSLPAIHWGGNLKCQPALTLAADGKVWLVCQGLWRNRGDAWEEIRPGGRQMSDARLVGHDSNRIWLADGDGLVAVNAAGSVAVRYTRQDLNIAASTAISSVASRGRRIMVATAEGLKSLEGKEWWQVPSPTGLSTITTVALAPNGSVWIAGEGPWNVDFVRLLPGFAVWTGSVAIIVMLVRLWMGSRHRDRVKYRVVVDEAGADSAEESAPAEVPALHPVEKTAVKPPAVKPEVKPAKVTPEVQPPAAKPQRRPSGTLRMIWAALAGVLVTAVLAWALLHGKPVRGPEPDGLLMVRLGFGLLAIAFVAGVCVLPFLAVVEYLRRGQYDQALRWTAFLGREGPRFRGMILALAGRPKAAEEQLRRSLSQAIREKYRGGHRSPSPQARDLDALGCVLMDQGRYDEARQCLEGAIQMGNGFGGPRNDMAELLLRQGRDPEKALELIGQALAAQAGSPMLRRLERYVSSWRWADKAWALALLGRRGEAGEAIDRALQEADRHSRPAMAGLHWRLGMALIAMDQPGQAAEHFRTASETDPQGKYGKLAIRELIGEPVR